MLAHTAPLTNNKWVCVGTDVVAVVVWMIGAVGTVRVVGAEAVVVTLLVKIFT